MNLEPWSTITTGSDAAQVRGVQYLLRARGHSVTADGLFGPQTAAAVRAFQANEGLTADGIVGPRTWPRLVVVTRAGSNGDAVRAVQQFGLIRDPKDQPLVVDGVFGPLTAERLRHFQQGWGLTIDGVAGRETWSFLRGVLLPRDPRWPLVKVGATEGTNRRVMAAQDLLRARGASIVVDGIFGPRSGQVIRAFQQTLRTTELSTTVGQLDWPHLVVTVRLGSTGDAVRAAQRLLGDVAVDGVFGPQTDAAVRLMQGIFFRSDDGIVGPETWRLLTQPIFK